MLRIALMGAGRHSLACHAPALQLLAAQRPGALALEVLCDLDLEKARRAAAQFGFARACAGIGEIVQGGRPIDAVVAVLPIPAMLSVTPALLALGVPLVIEKPLGRSLEEAQALREMIRKAGAAARVMVSFNRRFDPGIAKGVAWAAAQGALRLVRGTMVRYRRTEPEFVWGTGIHLIDALWHIAGPLTLESGGAVCPRPAGAPGAPGDNWRLALLRGRGGVAVALEILTTAGGGEEQIRLAGDGYHVDINTGAAPPWRVRGYRDCKVVYEDSGGADEPTCITNGTYQETVAFVDALARGGATPAPGIDDGLASSALAWGLQQAV